ncbi:MAG: hypothetical protein ACTIBG_00435 [Brevibacterium aurantiacum]|uniref:hypothetical protein n=1 Tax=Brevibacterium aurantiacum TaxID=273384 RepID=UPI003F90D90F
MSEMVLGRWGTFWWFLVLTAGIGAIAGVSLLVFSTAPNGFHDVLTGFSYSPFFALPGALLGLAIGLPAYAAIRLCLRALSGRTIAFAFFFVLGTVSALLGFVVFVMVFGGPSSYAYDSVSGVVATIAGPVLVAGALTAFASFRIVEPAEDVNLTSIGSSD